MPIDFFRNGCKSTLHDPLFGIRDDPPPANHYAYTSITNRTQWIAKVINTQAFNITFIAIDNCLDIRKPNGHIDSACDAMIVYNNKILFIELKECNDKNNAWIKKADLQLRNTIQHFSNNHQISIYSTKKAYIANNKHPNFRSTQAIRMEKFKDVTGVDLRIENTIILD